MRVSPHDSAITGPKPMSIPPPEDLLIQDPSKGLSELPNAIGVYQWIHNRVSMREDDGNVHHPDMWALTVLTQVVKAVNDVQWKPTQSEQTYNDGQRFGSMHFLLQD